MKIIEYVKAANHLTDVETQLEEELNNFFKRKKISDKISYLFFGYSISVRITFTGYKTPGNWIKEWSEKTHNSFCKEFGVQLTSIETVPYGSGEYVVFLRYDSENHDVISWKDYCYDQEKRMKELFNDLKKRGRKNDID